MNRARRTTLPPLQSASHTRRIAAARQRLRLTAVVFFSALVPRSSF